MAVHAPLVTGSWICCVPRLIIAPQAFLKPMRPSSFKLAVNPDAVAVGIYSGNVKLHLNYFPNIIHNLEALPENTVHEVDVGRRPELKGNQGQKMPLPKPNLLGPVGILPALGFVMSIGLLALAIVKNDGAAVVALTLLSVTSSFTGIGSLWDLQLQTRPSSDRDGVLPRADVLVRDTKGTFLIIHCDESIARELYFTQDSCNYRLKYGIFRICSGLATFSHMAGVVFLANCTWLLQAAIGLAYLILNGSYWFGAVLSPRVAWDLDLYDVHETPSSSEGPMTYTQCLWTVAVKTKTMRWARLGGIVPATEAWAEWVREAEENCESKPDWEYGKALNVLFEKHRNAEGKPHLVTGYTKVMEPKQAGS